MEDQPVAAPVVDGDHLDQPPATVGPNHDPPVGARPAARDEGALPGGDHVGLGELGVPPVDARVDRQSARYLVSHPSSV